MMKRIFNLVILFLATALCAAAQHPEATVVILGDSNTWYGGDDCSGPRAWTKSFNESYRPGAIRSYARSGATWTNVPTTVRDVEEVTGRLGDNNVIYNQVERLGDALADGTQQMPTLIIVMAGTNDAWFSSSRPGAFDTSAAEAVKSMPDSVLVDLSPSKVTSLALSARHNILRLRRLAPEAMIVLCGPLQCVPAPDNLIIAAGGIIEEIGQLTGCPAIRLDRDFGLSSASEAKKKVLTTDGAHTSVEGARLLGNFIASRIEALQQ